MRIVVTYSYSCRKLGDASIVDGTLDVLRRYVPHAEITLVSDDPARDRSYYPMPVVASLPPIFASHTEVTLGKVLSIIGRARCGGRGCRWSSGTARQCGRLAIQTRDAAGGCHPSAGDGREESGQGGGKVGLAQDCAPTAASLSRGSGQTPVNTSKIVCLPSRSAQTRRTLASYITCVGSLVGAR